MALSFALFIFSLVTKYYLLTTNLTYYSSHITCYCILRTIKFRCSYLVSSISKEKKIQTHNFFDFLNTLTICFLAKYDSRDTRYELNFDLKIIICYNFLYF